MNVDSELYATGTTDSEDESITDNANESDDETSSNDGIPATYSTNKSVDEVSRSSTTVSATESTKGFVGPILSLFIRSQGRNH